MSGSVWGQVLAVLESEFQSNLFQMWIRPLQVDETPDALVLLAPNPFFVRHIQDKFLLHYPNVQL